MARLRQNRCSRWIKSEKETAEREEETEVCSPVVEKSGSEANVAATEEAAV